MRTSTVDIGMCACWHANQECAGKGVCEGCNLLASLPGLSCKGQSAQESKGTMQQT